MRIPQQLPLGPRATGTAPETLLPIVLTFDDSDSPRDLIDALALTAFMTGDQPYARTKDLDNIRDDATLLPPGVTALRESRGDDEHARLAVGDGWTLRSVHWPRGKNATLSVTAVTDELSAKILNLATDGMTEQPGPVEDSVSMGFWYATSQGSHRSSRRINADSWADIRGNYARGAATQIDRLVGVDRDSVHGRLVLLHGPPGTGKTTALRSLAWEWRGWCQVDCVLDPEELFNRSAYLMEVALSKAGDCSCRDNRHEKWRLLLLEDCDELIRGEAKQYAGQALSRLLNLTDGLLGQGRKVLVAITTNEDLARLHPAVVRPGRCLARIEVPPLPFAEAEAWLAGSAGIPSGGGSSRGIPSGGGSSRGIPSGGGSSRGIPPGGATLAELYALRQGNDATVDREPVLSGQYL